MLPGIHNCHGKPEQRIPRSQASGFFYMLDRRTHNNNTRHPAAHSCQLRRCIFACLVLLLAAQAPAHEDHRHADAPQQDAVQPQRDSVQQIIAGRIRQLEAGEKLVVDGHPIASVILLPAIYKEHQYTPVWNNPRAVTQLLGAIRNIGQDGLNPSDYNLAALEKLLLRQARSTTPEPALSADLDLLLTDSLIRLGYPLTFGKVDPEALDPDWNMTRYVEDMDALVQQAYAIDNGKVDQLIESLRPQAPKYTQLKAALASTRKLQQEGGWGTVPAGATLKPGMSDPRVRSLRKRLMTTADMPVMDIESADFDAGVEQGVKNFQRRHGLEADGIVGKNTLAAMNVPVEDRIDQIRANLERARWALHDLPGTFILADIAGFRVSYFRDGEQVWQTRAQVGRPFRKSPIFKARMTYMEVNPTWTVPPTILREDVLPAIKRDPEYLASKNMRVLDYQGRPVDPATLDWSQYTGTNFPYLLRQEPGTENALGRIKFMFPNKHLVYLHDTPSKALFGKATRAFSSGCIRIEHPYELADLLVRNDPNWNKQKIIEAVNSLETMTIGLREPVTIVLLYWTVDFADDGSVIFKNDLYRRDPAIIAGLAEDFAFRVSQIIRD
jgi:murein L,D-transpeptidase YcbB/YkuD